MSLHQTIELRRNRVSIRAVVAGAVVELVILGLLLALAGGLGLFTIRPLTPALLDDLGAGLAVWVGLAWVIAALAGGFVAAAVGRAASQRDGVFHGLLSWAVACLVAGVGVCTWFMAAIATGLATPDVASAIGAGGMLAFFFGDLIAGGAALIGGALGARSEARSRAPDRSVRSDGHAFARSAELGPTTTHLQ